MITSLHVAFFLAIPVGMVVGLAVGHLQHMADPVEFALDWMFYGAIMGPLTFGAGLLFDRLFVFLRWEHNPASPRALLGFSVLAVIVILLALVPTFPKQEG